MAGGEEGGERGDVADLGRVVDGVVGVEFEEAGSRHWESEGPDSLAESGGETGEGVES